jgi:S-adenosylmethionine hydrolase
VRQLITFTTDFGTRDGFVAQMKGVALGINPHVILIDVTHDIRPFAILEGALVIKGVSRYFPPDTIHVAVVDPGVGSARRGIVLRASGQLFVGPDNGLFSFIINASPDWDAWRVTNGDLMLPNPHPTFHGRDVFTPVAAYLSRGTSLDEVGPLMDDPVVLDTPRPRETPDSLQGEVIYVDRFGNLSTNIEASHLKRPVAAVEIGDAKILGISRYFGQAQQGAPLALINSFGLLEIAMNQGNAALELGVQVRDQVRVMWARE